MDFSYREQTVGSCPVFVSIPRPLMSQPMLEIGAGGYGYGIHYTMPGRGTGRFFAAKDGI
jgi:hypothetical protein